jgi:hypothetical protein
MRVRSSILLFAELLAAPGGPESARHPCRWEAPDPRATDDEFQSLPGAAVDGDIGGNVGAEQMVVGLPRAGRYIVVVEALDGAGAGIEIGATFLTTNLAALAADPDGRPSGAVAVATGASHDDGIDLWSHPRLRELLPTPIRWSPAASS